MSELLGMIEVALAGNGGRMLVEASEIQMFAETPIPGDGDRTNLRMHLKDRTYYDIDDPAEDVAEDYNKLVRLARAGSRIVGCSD